MGFLMRFISFIDVWVLIKRGLEIMSVVSVIESRVFNLRFMMMSERF